MGPPCYYLVSAAGVRNFGDELIALSWLRHLARVAPDVDVVVDCGGPAADWLLPAHPRVRLVNHLWTLCVRNWSKEPHRAVAAARRAVAAAGPDDPLGPLVGASVVHVVGGGFVNGIWPAYHGLVAGAAAAAARSGARLALTGQGLWPPAAGGEQLLRELTRDAAVLDVRDRPSAELLGPGATASGDDVFLGLDPDADRPTPRPGDELPELMVSLQSVLSQWDDARLVGFLADLVRDWGVGSVGLVECAPEQDRRIGELVRAALPVTRCFSLRDCLTGAFPAVPGQTWVSTRFHPHLTAAAAGAGGVAISVSPDYYRAKHQSLVDAGSGWTVIDRLEAPPRPAAGGFPPARLRELRDGKRRLADRIYPPA